MGYAMICGTLVLIAFLATGYTKWKISQKKRIVVDIGIFFVMAGITIAFHIPDNLLCIGLLFLAWVILGNGVGYFWPKLWNRIENQFLKRKGIPCNQREDEEETGDTFICKLLYYTIELAWIAGFFWAVIAHLIS